MSDPHHLRENVVKSLQSTAQHDLVSLYEQCFKPFEYQELYYNEIDQETKFFMDSYYEAVKTVGLPHDTEVTVLDVGSGPVPVYAAATVAGLPVQATPRLSFADILLQNRLALKAWQLNQDDAWDWRKYFQSIATTATAASSAVVTAAQLEARTRHSVAKIMSCDVTQHSPITERYDIVQTTLCLEFAVTDEAAWRGCVARLAMQAEILIMAGALGNTSWLCGGTEYPSVSLSENIITTTLRGCGMQVLEYKTMPRATQQSTKPTDHTGVFFVIARKQQPIKTMG